MKHVLIVISLLSVICFSGINFAQEVQIPVDKDGKVELIDTELEKELELFKDYMNFREARLFQVSDSLFVLEVYYQPDKILLKARLPLTLDDKRIFQQQVSERILAKAQHVIIDQEGRSKLLAGLMTLSLGYYGWALPMSLDVHDGKLAVAMYMLTSGAGFYLPLSATRNKPVTDAAATLGLYCASRGIGHGIALTLLLSDDPTSQAVVGTGMVVSVAEGFSGFNIANNLSMSSGTAEMIGFGGDYGIGFGLGFAHLADLYNDDNSRAVGGSVLLGSGLGMFGFQRLANRQSYTRGDTYVLKGIMLLGAYIPAVFLDIVGSEEPKAYTAVCMAGSVGGIVFGDRIMQGNDFTTGQGILINLSGLAGGLFGLGTAYLVSSDNGEHTTMYLTSSAIGALLGFRLMYKSMARKHVTSEENLSFDFGIAPEGLIALARGKRSNFYSETTPPLLRFSLRF
ncbi:hypothetical protein K9N50_08495 [bacterium]|nr:hypothetical protein [bacterium]